MILGHQLVINWSMKSHSKQSYVIIKVHLIILNLSYDIFENRMLSTYCVCRPLVHIVWQQMMITSTWVVQTESFVCSVQHLYISLAQCQNLITSVSMLQRVMIPGILSIIFWKITYCSGYYFDVKAIETFSHGLCPYFQSHDVTPSQCPVSRLHSDRNRHRMSQNHSHI